MAKHHELVLEELLEELAEVRAGQAELDQHYANLQAAIAILEKRIAADGGSPAPRRLASMTMPDAVLACLDADGPLAQRDLMVRLVQSGRPKAQHFRTHVSNTLNRLHDQGKVERGDDGRWRRSEPKTVLSAATAGAGRPER